MWKKEMDTARLAALKAGETLNSLFGKVRHIEKKGRIDLVTEADLHSEKIILDIISGHFPNDSIITEESGGYNHLPERRWIVDPLDGTVNFAHGFPFFAVSIGLEINSEIVLGVVFNPSDKEHFEAVKGSGAFLNERPIKVSRVTEMEEALLGTGFPYDIHERSERVVSLFNRMLFLSQGVRRPGSAALDLCYVASGRFDGFWEEGLHPWDTAAGMIIVEEAGGLITTYDGGKYTPFEKTIVAANPSIHQTLVRAIKERPSAGSGL
jgi:myo-inositol-1(or 4)-monophosphatase